MAAHKSITGNHWCTVRKLAFSVKVHGATPAFVRDYHCFVCTACHDPFRDGCCEYTGSHHSFIWECARRSYKLIAICNATAVLALPSAWWRGQLHWGARKALRTAGLGAVRRATAGQCGTGPWPWGRWAWIRCGMHLDRQARPSGKPAARRAAAAACAAGPGPGAWAQAGGPAQGRPIRRVPPD